MDNITKSDSKYPASKGKKAKNANTEAIIKKKKEGKMLRNNNRPSRG